jgi:Tfp pilus assembly protein PilF
MCIGWTVSRHAVMGVCLLLFVAAQVHAACEPGVGRFVSVSGSVDVQPSAGGDWQSASLETALCEGDTIRVGERSRASVALANDAVLNIDQNTAIRLTDVTPVEEETSILDMVRGAFQSFSRKPKFLRVNTPYLNGSVEGTEFALRIEDDSATLTVLEGRVLASNDQGEVAVASGEAAQAKKGQAPIREIVVNPRDQVQWALYYPPILTAQSAAGGGADSMVVRASELLSVGRVDEARAQIDAALRTDPNASGALALRSIVNVTQNRNEEALADGQRAVEADPNSLAASIALSYAQQAKLDIARARDTLLKAVESNPDDALAWARLAETQLMLGDRGSARASAEKAVGIDSNLGRTQSVLGFTALAEMDTASARAAFEQAIALDASDPMSHLGRGLAKIRQGELAEGRADIEAAVALASNNALLRAYLGKAYFEEKRSPLDATQLEVAKELDPLDPTSYFYNAIRLQTENRPVEALRELEASVDRNDNRSVYRSRLLLDQDRAARGASQARIYNNLGFEQLGINQSTRSLALDPANASAHRFLADTYRQVPRREISRVSELLQAQLLQDVNINPAQPSIAATNLNIVTAGGPATPGFNEFTPLFQSNGAQFNFSGIAGNNDTKGWEGVVSGVYEKFSVSAGRFSYDTDGWRSNDDLDNEVNNVYAQVALSPQLNVQAEYTNRKTESGDIVMRFNPDDFFDDLRRDFEVDTKRLGVRWSIDQRSTVLLSWIDADRDEKGKVTQNLVQAIPPFVPQVDLFTTTRTKSDSTQAEGQYIFNGEHFNLIGGASYVDVDPTIKTAQTTLINGVPLFPTVSVADSGITDRRGYLYGHLNIPTEVTWTVGASYQEYDQGGSAADTDRWNPKLGVKWDVNEALSLRAAYFKVVKPALASNRMLEPTQVAGFNQYFDDANGTKSERYGAAVDWRVGEDVYLGAEATRREFEQPVSVSGAPQFEDRDEWFHRVYAYWAISDQLSLRAEAVYDKYESESVNPDRPSKLETVSVPVQLRYFARSGLFAGVGLTYVDQKHRLGNANPPLFPTNLDEGDDDFAIADLTLGYRLPGRHGILSASVHNLFDEEFSYRDDSFRTFQDEPAVAPYIPERTVRVQLSLNF